MKPIVTRSRSRRLAAVLAAALVCAGAACAGDERAALVALVADQIEDLAPQTGVPGLSAATRKALATVPRERFVPDQLRAQAYRNTPLPIGHGQTISQPLIVGLMTEMLGVGPEAVVLEVGTGSGYQAAILSPIVKHVYTMEIIAPLAEQATARLQNLGYANVTVRHGDGYHGWPEHAPFDAVIVTAAAGHVPPPLIEQLKPGGRMAIPVGGSFYTQQLLLIEKDPSGKVSTRQVLPVRFVPLTGDH